MKPSKITALDLISKSNFDIEPIHPKFEIRLLVVVFEKHSSNKCSRRALDQASRNFQSFLEKCFTQNFNPSNDSLTLGQESENPENSINLSRIRKSIRTLQKQKNYLNIKRLQSSTDGFMLQMEWEMRVGFRDQEQGENQNKSVFRIRGQEIRNREIHLGNINNMDFSIF